LAGLRAILPASDFAYLFVTDDALTACLCPGPVNLWVNAVCSLLTVPFAIALGINWLVTVLY
jgi:hypothetical protein